MVKLLILTISLQISLLQIIEGQNTQQFIRYANIANTALPVGSVGQYIAKRIIGIPNGSSGVANVAGLSRTVNVPGLSNRNANIVNAIYGTMPVNGMIAGNAATAGVSNILNTMSNVGNVNAVKSVVNNGLPIKL